MFLAKNLTTNQLNWFRIVDNGQVIAKTEKQAIEYCGNESNLKNAIGNNIFKVILDEDGEQVWEW